MSYVCENMRVTDIGEVSNIEIKIENHILSDGTAILFSTILLLLYITSLTHVSSKRDNS